jgi:protein translocase SecG subunit
MLNTLITIIQIVTALALVALLAIQTDKAEQSGGVMGLGAAGGRSSGGVELAVGPERILKPLTTWIAVGFLFSSLLNAIPKDNKGLSPVTFLVVVALYLFVMLVGGKIWKAFTRVFGS